MIRRLVFFTAITAIAASGQTTTATLRGEVRDPSGASIAGSAIHLDNQTRRTNGLGVISSTGVDPRQVQMARRLRF